MLLTWLSQTETKRYLKEYTHSEIRNWKYENWEFLVTDLITKD
jgi:hypothetical protein